MKDKKLRISKEDLGDGKEGETDGDETVSIPVEGKKKKGKEEKRSDQDDETLALSTGSTETKGEGKEKAARDDETREQKAPPEPKTKKNFRPKLKSPLPSKGKKGGPGTKKGSPPRTPEVPSAPQAERGFIRRQHPMVLVGSGIALFAVFFAGTFLLIDVLKTDRQRSQEVIEYSTKAVAEVQEGIARAQREELPYSFLQDLAEASDDLSGKVEGRKRSYEAEVTDKPQLTGPTLAVLDADLEFLRSFAALATVKDARLGRRWRQIKREMRSAVEAIDGERPAIESEVSDDPTLLPTERSLDRSVGSANRIVVAANTKLQDWFAQLRRIKNQCERARAFSGIASSLVGEYREQRSATNAALEQPRLDWDVAGNILSDEAARRDELASRFAGEQAPLLAQASWIQMGQLVQESVRVLSAGSEGINTEPFPTGRFWQGSVTKSQFDSASQDISSQIDSTEPILQSELAEAEDQACNQKKPPRPAV